MSINKGIDGYKYVDANLNCSHACLLPALDKALREFKVAPTRAFDLGCGNGSVAQWLSQRGFDVTGVDPSIEGIREANTAYPHLTLKVGSAYDPLNESFGKFKLLTSLEVVEHVYAPKTYAKTVRELLADDGIAIISTPYHGYFKNLALAITGKMDAHFTALWDHGHIKFWSEKTITQLLEEASLKVMKIYRVGRIPALAMGMVVVAKPV